mgnify:CR=1 FL=1
MPVPCLLRERGHELLTISLKVQLYYFAKDRSDRPKLWLLERRVKHVTKLTKGSLRHGQIIMSNA